MVMLWDDVGFGQFSAFGGLCDTPTLDRLADRSLPPRTRAYAAAALGVLCDRDAERWGAVLAREFDYRASTTTISGEGGLGLLGLL